MHPARQKRAQPRPSKNKHALDMNLTDHPEDLRNLISLITKKVLGQTTPEDDAALDA